MESTSEPMKIQISEATQQILDKKRDTRRSSITINPYSQRSKFITQLRDEVTIFLLYMKPLIHKIFVGEINVQPIIMING